MKNRFEVRWADVDANGHMRHSAYYDYAAHARVRLLAELGVTLATFQELQIGPVLFREEARFFKEFSLSQKFHIETVLNWMTKSGRKFQIAHTFYNDKNEIATTITVDLAWIDLIKRKIAVPPDALKAALVNFPKAEDFTIKNSNND